MAGQSINDRLTAAKYSLAGQGLAKSVCKATTEEVIGPKKKHLDYLLHCTNEPNVSIPQLANLLIERSQLQSWVSVFKALITVHHMMCYGNERFTQYLASSNCNFNLGGFLDKTGATATGQNQPQLSYDMSTFIRRYAKYINEKAISYRSVAFDFCKTKRGKDDGTLRTMPTDTLLKTLPILQAQVDALLDFDCSSSELNNGVINSAFMLLFRDLIRLFACYNDGIINLLEKYFEMNKKQARDALDCYKKFLIRMDRVSEFLKVAEAIGMEKSEIPDLKQNIGIDKGEIPDLKKNNSKDLAPSSLLDALESHLASLEGKKVPTSTSGGASGVNLKNAVSALNSTSCSFGLACSNGRIGENGTTTNGSSGNLDELTKRAALAEEEALYEKLKEHGKNNPFLSSPVNEPGATATTTNTTSNAAPSNNIVDLFGGGAPDQPAVSQSSRASDDLLQLGNPFADVIIAGAAASPVPMSMPHTNGFSTVPPSFVSDNAFKAAFGDAAPSSISATAPGIDVEANPFADMGANPDASSTGIEAPAATVPSQGSAFDGFGDILQPQGTPAVATMPVAPPSTQPAKLISGDLDMCLSSLVDNLNIKGPPPQKQQWNSPKAQSKTGTAGWSGPMGGPPTGFRQPAPMSVQGQWPVGAPPGNPTFQPPMAMATSQPAQQAAPSTGFDPFGGL